MGIEELASLLQSPRVKLRAIASAAVDALLGIVGGIVGDVRSLRSATERHDILPTLVRTIIDHIADPSIVSHGLAFLCCVITNRFGVSYDKEFTSAGGVRLLLNLAHSSINRVKRDATITVARDAGSSHHDALSRDDEVILGAVAAMFYALITDGAAFTRDMVHLRGGRVIVEMLRVSLHASFELAMFCLVAISCLLLSTESETPDNAMLPDDSAMCRDGMLDAGLVQLLIAAMGVRPLGADDLEDLPAVLHAAGQSLGLVCAHNMGALSQSLSLGGPRALMAALEDCARAASSSGDWDKPMLALLEALSCHHAPSEEAPAVLRSNDCVALAFRVLADHGTRSTEIALSAVTLLGDVVSEAHVTQIIESRAVAILLRILRLRCSPFGLEAQLMIGTCFLLGRIRARMGIRCPALAEEVADGGRTALLLRRLLAECASAGDPPLVTGAFPRDQWLKDVRGLLWMLESPLALASLLSPPSDAAAISSGMSGSTAGT